MTKLLYALTQKLPELRELSPADAASARKIPSDIEVAILKKDMTTAREKIFLYLKDKEPLFIATFYASLTGTLKQVFPVWTAEHPGDTAQAYFVLKDGADVMYLDSLLAFRLIRLATLNHDVEMCHRAARQFTKNRERYPPTDAVTGSILECDPQDESVMGEFKDTFAAHLRKKNEGEDNVKENYRRLYEIFAERNICWIVMQYPRRNVSVLKNYFSTEQQKNLRFVSNADNFEQELKNRRFEELFSDRFANDFGHTTERGHQLIADRVYPVAAEAIKDTRCAGIKN